MNAIRAASVSAALFFLPLGAFARLQRLDIP
jgi:hypothetical protein